MNRWPQRAKRIAAVIAALVALQTLALGAYRLMRNRKVETPAASTFEVETLTRASAQALELERPDGSAVRLADLRGKPVLVHFWATWCTPCREEIPALLERATEHEGKLQVLAISLDDNWPAVRLFFDGDIPKQVSRADDAQVKARYGVTTLPDTFVLSATGELIARARGARDWRSDDAERALEAWEGTHSR